jgi:hypothetical protein
VAADDGVEGAPWFVLLDAALHEPDVPHVRARSAAIANAAWSMSIAVTAPWRPHHPGGH